MAQKVAIVGAGRIGKALEQVLRAHHKNATLLGAASHSVLDAASLKKEIPSARAIFLCVPSWATREVLHQLLAFYRKNTIIVSFAKGLEEKSRKRVDEIFEEILPLPKRYGVCAGPMMAEDLAEGFLGRVVVGSKTDRKSVV